MIAILMLLAAAAAPQTSPPAAYPLAQVLDGARQACGREGLPAGHVAGWEPFEPEAGSWFAAFVARSSEGGGGMKVSARTYRKRVSGRVLLAFVTQLRFSFAPGAPPAYSCDVFDPEAPPVAAPALRKWARRSPKRTSAPGSSPVFAVWDPGLARGNDETTISWLPERGLSYSAVGRTRRR